MKRSKRLEAVRNNPGSVRFDELLAALKDAGFVLARRKGSHRIFVNHQTRARLVLQPGTNGMAKPYQVRQFLALIAPGGGEA